MYEKERSPRFWYDCGIMMVHSEFRSLTTGIWCTGADKKQFQPNRGNYTRSEFEKKNRGLQKHSLVHFGSCLMLSHLILITVLLRSLLIYLGPAF